MSQSSGTPASHGDNDANEQNPVFTGLTVEFFDYIVNETDFVLKLQKICNAFDRLSREEGERILDAIPDEDVSEDVKLDAFRRVHNYIKMMQRR